jgi:hypothetical protein
LLTIWDWNIEEPIIGNKMQVFKLSINQ